MKKVVRFSKGLLRALLGDRTREPARLVTRGTAAVTGIVGLCALWGLDISPQTQTAILTTMSTVIPVLVGVGEFIRPYVTPVKTAEKAIDEAWIADPAVDPKPTLAKVG